MELIRRFADEVVLSALESWSFVDLNGLTPVFASPFGDVFFEGRGGFWFLDLMGGDVRLVASTGDELTALLNSPEGQDEYLLAALATAADAAGIVPGPTEVYDFVVPPVLGGSIEIGNLQAADFVVTVDLSGQIHAQVRDLPEGTPITGFQLG